MSEAPNIGVPSIIRKGFKNRVIVGEFSENITLDIAYNSEQLDIPTFPLLCEPERDFGYFLGSGTLEITLPLKKFIENSTDLEVGLFRHSGQAEYLIKPGLTERMPVSFFYDAAFYQFFIFLDINPEEVGGGDSNVFLILEQDIQNSHYDTAIFLSDDFETLGFYDESDLFFSESAYLLIGTSDENQRFFSETSYLFIGTSDENQRFTSSAEPLFL